VTLLVDSGLVFKPKLGSLNSVGGVVSGFSRTDRGALEGARIYALDKSLQGLFCGSTGFCGVHFDASSRASDPACRRQDEPRKE
jgi:hypothetical protein